ncbi:MurR/RpiR family transcriptional regulator [Streptomyces sp. NPDC001255]|uniref:MurR/RpiR family transcriptional regulator n=1 Tax=Streptomyces sp. NPDC001255 TaxID=3364550 RepID=UPI0036A56011
MNDEPCNSVPEDGSRLRRWLGTVRARSAGLPASEAKVVALLLSDPLFVGTSTTAQVARRAGVSAPSVVRAARAIGLAGFTELKLEIARARGAAEFFAPPRTLTEEDSTETVVRASITTGIDALTALGGALDPEALEKAVAAARGAEQLVAYGAGPSATVAADAVFRLRALGVRTAGIGDHESAMIAARLLEEGDVVIAVSSTGRTAMTVAVADAASAAGATVIAITNQYGTPLADLAEIALVVGGASLATQMAAAGSRLAQLVVVDALAAALALRDPGRVRRAERAGIDLPDLS